MVHDFNKFPELTNEQMKFYYFESPHRQILEDITALVKDVHDGDTIKLEWNFRDFDFPLRFSNIASPELKEDGGEESREWLKERLLGKTVQIKINPTNRVEKWGRLLGRVYDGSRDVGEESVLMGHSVLWEHKNDGKIKFRIPEVK